MKKIVLIAAAAALVFASCNKNEHTPNMKDNAVRFIVEDVVTRVTTSGTTSTFTNGDQIAITSAGLDGDITNEVYGFNSDNGTLTGKTVCYKDDASTAASFVAHYPATLNNESGVIAMTVDSDQTDETKFHNQMFMVATATGDPAVNEGLVSFKFEQQLSFVKVVLSGIEATAVELNNIQPSISWANSATTLGTSELVTINAWNVGENEYWALIPAQTIAGGTQLVTIKTASDDYTFTLGETQSLEFTTANVKTITLSLPQGPSGNGVEATFSNEGMNPDDWTVSTETGNLAVKPYVPVQVVKAEDAIVLPETKATTYTSGTGWNWILEKDTDSITASENSVTLNLTYIPKDEEAGTPASSWTKNGVFYSLTADQLNSVKNSRSKIYKMSFTYTSDANIRFLAYSYAGTTVTQLNNFGKADMSDNAVTTRTLGAKEAATPMTYYFDLTDYAAETLSFFFGMSGNTANATISNISFEEYITVE